MSAGGASASGAERFDYVVIGHVTADVLGDGARQPGGTAFYSALQAARLGRRTLVVTRGAPDEIERLLAPYAAELTVRVQPAAATTTLATRGRGYARAQRMLAWAGAIAERERFRTDVLHLAPVAREVAGRWSGQARFLGLTAQGLLRTWGADGQVHVGAPAAIAGAGGAPDERATLALARACDALVLDAQERSRWPPLVATAQAAGSIVAVTDGHRPTQVLDTGAADPVAVPALASAGDDLGAGDVFAAAFFVALAEERDAVEAAAFANAAAAVRMAGSGAGAIGDYDAVERRLRAAVPQRDPRA
jgi:sugar/nucleoside kinase (ribokinase family)